MASQKEIWIEQIRKLKESELTVKALAGILEVNKSRIYKDLESEKFEDATKNGVGTKSTWVFTHEAAIKYVKKFKDTTIIIEESPGNKTPPSKKLKIPGWTWE
jgi:hypothetical protein